MLESELMKGPMPPPALNRIESLKEIHVQRILEDQSLFAEFRNQDIFGEQPASLVRQSSLDIIERDEKNIAPFLDYSLPAFSQGSAGSPFGSFNMSGSISDGSLNLRTLSNDSFTEGAMPPFNTESSIDGAFSKGGASAPNLVRFTSTGSSLEGAFNSNYEVDDLAGIPPLPFAPPPPPSSSSSSSSLSLSSNSVPSSASSLAVSKIGTGYSTKSWASDILREDQGGSNGSETSEVKEQKATKRKVGRPKGTKGIKRKRENIKSPLNASPIVSMSADEFDEKVKILNDKRESGAVGASPSASTAKKPQCEVFDTVEKLVSPVMCKHSRLRGGSEKMRKRAERLGLGEETEKFYRYLKKRAEPGEESDDETTTEPPFRFHARDSVKENKWYNVCDCMNKPRCFQIKLSSGRQKSKKKKGKKNTSKTSEGRKVPTHPASSFKPFMDKYRKQALRGLITYCMFRGGFEDRTHGVERHNQKPTTNQINEWKKTLVGFGLPVSAYIDWAGEGNEKYWPKFLLVCMAGLNPSKSKPLQSQGLEAMRKYMKDFFSSFPNGNGAKLLHNPMVQTNNEGESTSLAGAAVVREVSSGDEADTCSGQKASPEMTSLSAHADASQAMVDAEPHRSPEDYLRVSLAFLDQNFRILKEKAPHLDPSGGAANTYEELLQYVTGGSGQVYFQRVETMNNAESLPRVFIKIYMYIHRGNLYHLFGDHKRGLDDLQSASLLLAKVRESDTLIDVHIKDLDLRLNFIKANILKERDGWKNEELEDIFQMIEFTATCSGLRDYAKCQRVVRKLNLAYLDRSDDKRVEVSNEERTAMRALEFLETNYSNAWENGVNDHEMNDGDDVYDDERARLWVNLQRIQFEKIMWAIRLNIFTLKEGVTEFKRMVEGQRQYLGESNNYTIGIILEVAKLLLEHKDIDAGSLAEAKNYIDYADRHALKNVWIGRKLEDVRKLYHETAASDAGSDGPPRKKKKTSK